MLDGRSVIEVSWSSHGRRDNNLRVWVIRFHREPHRFTIAQAGRVDSGWLVMAAFATAKEFPTLRDARKHLFRGNGRLTGGHPEVTGAVTAPMSIVNVKALCSIRTAPGDGDYWDTFPADRDYWS